ncbi:MAG: CDP-diacylglycerol--serine O-phosphatidyltransferase [Thermodesulfobacteriota bacterium]
MAKLEKKDIRNRINKEKLIPIVPNLLTTSGLILGLASIMTSLEIVTLTGYSDFSSEKIFMKFWWASAFIGFAVIMDMFDGKVARALKSSSKFGTSYDSLSDLVSFGVAPAVLIYVWCLMSFGKLALMAIFFYVVCAALRLARFNIQSKDAEKDNFTGLPSPMAAGLILAPILLFSEFHIAPAGNMTLYYLFATPILGLIMVSDIPYKKFPDFSNVGQFNVLVIGAIIITAVITNPGIMVAIVTTSYFLLGLSTFIFDQFKKRVESKKEREIINR